MAEDALTGLHDRKAFQLALRRQVGAANERQESLALRVVDVGPYPRECPAQLKSGCVDRLAR